MFCRPADVVVGCWCGVGGGGGLACVLIFPAELKKKQQINTPPPPKNVGRLIYEYVDRLR